MGQQVITNSTDYLRIILVNWRKVVLAGAICAAIATITVFVMPRTFESTVTLLVYPPVFKESEQALPRRTSTTMEEARAEISEMMPRTFPVETLRAIAQSKDLMKELIDTLKLEDTLIEDLSRDLSTELIQLGTRSPTYGITYSQTMVLHAKADDPKLAAQLAQTWAGLFKRRVDDLAWSGIEEAYQLIDTMWGGSKKEVEKAEDDFEVWRKQWNMDLMKAEKKAKEELLTTLETDLDQTEVKIADSAAQLAAIQEELAKEKRIDTLFRAPSDDVYWLLKKSPSGGQEKTINPKEGLATEMFNPTYTVTREKEVTSKSELQGLENKKKRLESKIKELRDEVAALQNDIAVQETRSKRLNRDITTFEGTYKLVAEKLEKGKMAKMNRTSDIQIAGKAVEPQRPVGMRRAGRIVTAAVVGVLIGLAYVVVEYSTRGAQAVPSG